MVFVKPVMKNLSILKINVKMYSVLHVQVYIHSLFVMKFFICLVKTSVSHRVTVIILCICTCMCVCLSFCDNYKSKGSQKNQPKR